MEVPDLLVGDIDAFFRCRIRRGRSD